MKKEQTTDDITQRGLRALARELGPTGFVKFMRRFGAGKGDYTRDRHQWLDKVSVDEMFDSIFRRHGQRKRSTPKPSKKERRRSA